MLDLQVSPWIIECRLPLRDDLDGLKHVNAIMPNHDIVQPVTVGDPVIVTSQATPQITFKGVVVFDKRIRLRDVPINDLKKSVGTYNNETLSKNCQQVDREAILKITTMMTQPDEPALTMDTLMRVIGVDRVYISQKKLLEVVSTRV